MRTYMLELVLEEGAPGMLIHLPFEKGLTHEEALARKEVYEAANRYVLTAEIKEEA